MTIRIIDQADEFRIEIFGRFADAVVKEAEVAWKAALREASPRRISIDITHMTGYDDAGHLLLGELQAHGTHIVAGTPRSLLFLSQISTPKRSFPPISYSATPKTAGNSSKRVVTMPFRAAASGE